MELMRLFRKDGEDGFTTAGMAVALLLSVVLAFGAVQAHWTQSRSGQVQYVADAAALAADGAVAELIVYAQTIDAALLSLSLIGVASYAACGVAAFVPGGQGVAAKFADFGSRVFRTRDSFLKTAQKGLDAAQALMPAICTKRACEVIEANSRTSGVSYHGIAVPLPLEGEKLSFSSGKDAQEAAQDIGSRTDDVEEEVQKQKRAQEQMDKEKLAAWKADCGDSPSMMERASTLAGLSGFDNPCYASVDVWSFNAALERAKTYYAARLEAEDGTAALGSPELVGQSIARKAYYAYALSEVSKGHVGKDAYGAESPELKELARNTKQVKETPLYTDAAYPVGASAKGKVLHAWGGCPAYKGQTPAGRAAVSAIDAGEVLECEQCRFSATTLGRVPSASTSINNGFEYHYRLVVEASKRYKDAAEQAALGQEKLERAAGEMKDLLKEAFASLADARIDIQPPGRYGCVCIVVADESELDIGGSFIDVPARAGKRMAISGASLAVDENVDQSQVLSAIGAGLVPQEGLADSVAKTVFGCWGDALGAYAKGTDGVVQVVSKTIGSIPLVGTDLSAWVAAEFEEAAQASGLKPAELKAYKPVLVNTQVILEADGSSLASALLGAKSAAQAASEASAGDLTRALDLLKGYATGQTELDAQGVLVLATLSLAVADLGLGEKSLGIDDMQGVEQLFSQVLSELRGKL